MNTDLDTLIPLYHNPYARSIHVIVLDPEPGADIQRYEQQTAGVCCDHPIATGVLRTPVFDDPETEEAFQDALYAAYGLSDGTQNPPHEIIERIGDKVNLRALRPTDAEHDEAWVRCTYQREDGTEGRAILTWPNSD